MSCTENGSTSFVVVFLPAVIGCLTVILARRWANSNVSASTSTAISRRRKIIKDPLVKRPLPTVTYKMTQMGPKKSNAVAKKVTLPVEEESPILKKAGRPIRLVAANIPLNDADVKISEGLSAPKHMPFPYIPQDGELLFEIMTFVFVLVATGLQYLNLYRTAWWLPQSFATQAMHFYLIDLHVVAFIVIFIIRRLLLSVSMAVIRCLLSRKLVPHANIAARMFVVGVVLGALALCTYFLVLKYPISKIFYLCYPVIIYFLLFGFDSYPFLEISNADIPPLHNCSNDPQAIRAEVDVLRDDFNLRVKKIIFNSVVGAYYSSFLPCCFAPPYLYYDVYKASQQIVFVCGGLFARYANHLLSATHCDVPHRTALHLGRWRLDNVTSESDSSLNSWSDKSVWGRGSRVRHAGGVYTCSEHTVAIPADNRHARFHMVFANPSTLLCMLLCLQISLVVLQICLLFTTTTWHYFLSTVILLFINYYTLFKMTRDYLVAWKVYKAESLIQERTGLPLACN